MQVSSLRDSAHNLEHLPAKLSSSPEFSPHSIPSDSARIRSSVSPGDVGYKALSKRVFRISSYPIAGFY